MPVTGSKWLSGEVRFSGNLPLPFHCTVFLELVRLKYRHFGYFCFRSGGFLFADFYCERIRVSVSDFAEFGMN